MAQTFEELIGAHLDGMYSAALCFTMDEHGAEELLQAAAIRGFNQFSLHRHIEDVGQWMLKVLVETYLERERRRGEDPLEETPASERGIGNGVPWSRLRPFPERGTVEHGWLTGWMGRAWKQLHAGDRLVLWLADVERLRHTVLADWLGTDAEQVRHRHYRARRAMSKSVKEQLQHRESGISE